MNQKQKNAEIAKKHCKYVLDFYSNEIKHSIVNSKIYEEDHTFPSYYKKYSSTSTTLLECDSTTALLKHHDGKACVLNFASFKNPGGAFLSGSTTQEEMLCRESILYPVLCQFKESFYIPNRRNDNYGLYSSRAIYSKDVIFMRNEEEVMADALTIAAPNLNMKDKHSIPQAEVNKVQEERIHRIFQICADNECATLILGAFGCGVFKNNPKDIAKLFIKYAGMYDGVFKNIIYAIPGGKNYEAFQACLNQYK